MFLGIETSLCKDQVSNRSMCMQPEVEEDDCPLMLLISEETEEALRCFREFLDAS